MKRLLLPALLLTTLTACTATPAGTLPAAAPTPTPASTPAPTAAPAPADALTPEEKIGQLFIIRPDALDLTLPQETINDAGQQIIRRQLNVEPTLTIRPGFPVRVIVTRDLVLEPYGG